MAADGAQRGKIFEIRPRGPLERALGIFTDVRAGEAPTALFLMVNVFLLFTAYYLIKPVREALILAGGETDIFGWTVGKPFTSSEATTGAGSRSCAVSRAATGA